MNMADGLIEVYCDRCRELVQKIDVEESFEDATFSCHRCKQPVYWKTCPNCETGYSTTDEGMPCPECRR
jgi:hypothetical protein